jgi:NAD(P)-dependent dehydrogenase (short-subunit alcohol dehydrogenase family)
VESDSAHVAIVTGAGSGIGFALASVLAADGKTVVLADRDEASAQSSTARLTDEGLIAHGVLADVTDRASLDALLERATSLGELRTLCLNAGVVFTGTNVWETTDAVIDHMLNVNLRSLFTGLASMLPSMFSHGKPANVLITASMAGLVASPTSAAYSASKAGAVAIAKSLRDELASVAPQIGVTVLAPGMVKTNLMRTSASQGASMTADMIDRGHENLNTYGLEPAEIARIAVTAMHAGQFWALPPASDMFAEMLRTELTGLLGQL